MLDGMLVRKKFKCQKPSTISYLDCRDPWDFSKMGEQHGRGTIHIAPGRDLHPLAFDTSTCESYGIDVYQQRQAHGKPRGVTMVHAALMSSSTDNKLRTSNSFRLEMCKASIYDLMSMEKGNISRMGMNFLDIPMPGNFGDIPAVS